MSFASEVKAEICRDKIERHCCAIAECYGILLFCRTFSPSEIRIQTANEDFARRLPKLFKKAFGISFDVLPDESKTGKFSFVLSDEEKLGTVFNAFDLDRESVISHHVNFSVIENDCCRTAFVRGAFLAGGTVTDPEKRYHLELSTRHKSVAGEMFSILLDLNFSPKESERSGTSLLYFKQADTIADFITAIGAPVTAMKVLTSKVEKEMRNTVTRQINCDSANADKTVAASQEQIAAIKRYAAAYGLDSLPEPLKDAAFLRITNPEVSLSDLSRLSSPRVTKSCLSHRLKKIIAMAPEE